MSDVPDIPVPDAAAAPGWYPDPHKPGSFRRWDGVNWRGRSMQLRRSGGIGYPDAIQKSLWTTANLALRIASWLLAANLLALIATAVVSQLSGKTGDSLPVEVLAVTLVIACISGTAGMVTAVVGLLRSRQLGGLGSAIWTFWIGLPVLAGSVVFLVLVAGLRSTG